MARIRSIKPEFWTSEQIADCSPIARLLFIGMWSFSDDQGVHPGNVKRLKMEVFPGDSITVDEVSSLIDELLACGLLECYSAEGAKYWRVTGWHHQKIDQPTYKYPDASGIVPSSPPKRRLFAERSPSVHQVFTPGEERKGEERKGEEGKGEEGKGEEGKGEDDIHLPAIRVPACPHALIVGLYNEHLASNGLPVAINPSLWDGSSRHAALLSRWKESPDRQDIGWWERFFLYVKKSDFLMGATDKPFKIDAEWLFKKANFIKILEGKYHG